MKAKSWLISVIILLFLLVPTVSRAGTNEWTLVGLSGKDVRVITFDPFQASTMYVGTFYQGVFKSIDEGITWTELNLPIGSITAIKLDFNTPDVAYALMYGGLYKSTDGGGSWTGINYNGGFANVMEMDPQDPARLYLGFWYATGGGISKTTDGGTTWTFLGLDGYDVVELVIDPDDPAVIYAGTSFDGVFASVDGGINWTAANTGLTNLNISAMTIDPVTPSTIYAGTRGGGVFVSTNSGQSWTEINSGLTNLYIYTLTIDPTAPSTIYAGTMGGGVFVSTNSGQNWTEFNAGLTNLYIWSMTVSPNAPSTIYAGTQGDGLFEFTISQSITASINIDPDTLNLKSNRKRIIAYITLPGQYDVNQIDQNSIHLHYNNQIVQAYSGKVENSVYRALFDWNQVKALLAGVNGIVQLKVSGVVDETPFEGTDMVKVIFKEKK